MNLLANGELTKDNYSKLKKYKPQIIKIMMKVTVVEELHPFEKPKMMTEEEYHSLKFILRNDPNKDIAPPSDFVSEFSGFFIAVAVFIISIALVNFIEFMSLIAGISIIVVVVMLITGVGKSMINYNKYLSRRRKYFNQLKELIISTPDYMTFKKSASNI